MAIDPFARRAFINCANLRRGNPLWQSRLHNLLRAANRIAETSCANFMHGRHTDIRLGAAASAQARALGPEGGRQDVRPQRATQDSPALLSIGGAGLRPQPLY